jgi:hypothetical protein
LNLPPAPASGAPDPVQVVVPYADGTPAVVERSFGKGHVVLFSSTATTDWTNLPIHPDFVPFLQRLTSNLAGGQYDAESLRVAPGGTFQTVVNSELAGRELLVTRPGDHGAWHGAGKVELAGQQAVIRSRNTDRPGGYRFKVAGSDAAVAAFAVQIDPHESDLKMLAPDRLASLVQAGHAGPSAGSDSAAGDAVVTQGGGTRRELWLPLLVCAALVALVETILAQRFSLVR